MYFVICDFVFINGSVFGRGGWAYVCVCVYVSVYGVVVCFSVRIYSVFWSRFGWEKFFCGWVFDDNRRVLSLVMNFGFRLGLVS